MHVQIHVQPCMLQISSHTIRLPIPDAYVPNISCKSNGISLIRPTAAGQDARLSVYGPQNVRVERRL